MKLILIQLYNTFVQQGQVWYLKKRKMAYAPTTLSSLAACIPPDLNFEVELIDEGVEILDPEEIHADVVGLSVMTSNAPRAYEMSAKLRSRGIVTILGGFHPTLCPDEAMQHADAVVTGFGEVAFPLLLRDLQEGKLKKVYSESCDPVFINEMPAPRRDLLRRRRYILPNTVELTRGCPNTCDFCSVPGFCGRNYIKRDIDQTIRELERFRGKRVTFLDSSPTEDLGYIKEFYRALMPLNITWYSCATLKIADDDEWLDLAARSGCRGVLVGFESLNEASVQEENKPFNDVNKYEYLIRRLQDRKIAVLGTLMFGFDQDTPDIFRRTVDFVDRSRMDMVHYAINTPFPGTPEFEKLDREGRVLSRDWSLYDGTHAVFQPANMSVEELEKGYYWAFKKSHTLPSILKRTRGSHAGNLFTLASNIAFRQLSNVLVPADFKYREYDIS